MPEELSKSRLLLFVKIIVELHLWVHVCVIKVCSYGSATILKAK